MKEVQRRALAHLSILAVDSPQALLKRIRKSLKVAFDRDMLGIRQEVIFQCVQLEPSKEDRRDSVIIGGPKAFRRDPASARLIRDDHAWLHFTLTVRQHERGRLEILAYDFELVFPDGHVPPFIRFDLNMPGHANEDRELRSHLHPGNDDLQLPAPVMTPEELLELLLVRVRPRDPSHPRD